MSTFDVSVLFLISLTLLAQMFPSRRWLPDVLSTRAALGRSSMEPSFSKELHTYFV